MNAFEFGNDWDEALKGEFEKPYFAKLRDFLRSEYSAHSVHPDLADLFSAFRASSYSDTRVVIVGQDPYPGAGQAHGMCFSVRPGVPIPPSLRNIFKELKDEFGYPMPQTGYLKPWADQGALLLNAVLTCRDGQTLSHRGKGWETFTDAVLAKLNEKSRPVVFLLWGNSAKAKARVVTDPRHAKLFASHPSPLSASRGFFGCGHFVKANSALIGFGEEPIDWRIPPTANRPSSFFPRPFSS